MRAKLTAPSSINFDIRKCRGHQTRFRARIGEYRLIYQVDESSEQVLVLKLDTRGDVY
jgi:mRNA-degrading endonuclease RelE of RelBE toxin-antitoxin system